MKFNETNISHILFFNNAAIGYYKGQQSPSAITRSQLRTFGQQRVAGAIPDLRPSLDSDVRTTLITGVGSCPFIFSFFSCEIPVQLYKVGTKEGPPLQS